jgi:beta-galactosidase
MTAFSAKVDEHGQWFNTPLPGRLSDVFGLKTNAFYDIPAALRFQLGRHSIETKVHHYEVLEPSTATVVARFTNTADHTPAVRSTNSAREMRSIWRRNRILPLIGPLMNYLYSVAGIQPGPKTPEGVFARVVDGRTLYVNTTGEEKRIPSPASRKESSAIASLRKSVVLGPMEADLIQ